ncbi:MAG: rhamnulokinase, partial [Acidobacteriaceae bacterium]|nr:rhamnulokinase [Acidobacteriaceae bacterium]MBV9294116.1 rhamnulokinase [Acidobacteriaceae bacterium]
MTGRYLALDLGAESGRAILAQLDENRVELSELHRFPNTPVQLPTGLYWDTLRLFHEICEGIRAAGKVAERLDGIAIDTWGVDFGLLGADGALLENPRHYRDTRTQGVLDEMFKTVPRSEIFERTGIQFMEINSLCQLYAAKRDSPWLLNVASKLLFMPDLFNYFLTGAVVSERTVASTSQFYDPVGKRFADDILRKLDISTGFFADLADPGTKLGPLLPQVAAGCHSGGDAVVYTTGSHDTASAVVAVPASGVDGWCYISSGTWSLMGVELDEPIINSASLESNFTNEVGVGGTIRFLKNIPGLWVLQECRRAWAREGHEYSYGELMERAASAKMTDTILDLDEFASPGDHPQRIRDYCRKTGQEVPQDAGSMSLVILRSLAERYKQVLERLETLTGKQIQVIHIVGGGSRNKLLNQLVADVTGRRVLSGPAEATAAGNALTQAMGAGRIRSLDELREVVR